MRLNRYGLVLLCLLLGCKDDFLNVKPDKALLVPVTLEDFRALLDNSNTIMNYVPALMVLAGDDFKVADNGFPLTSNIERKSYLWQNDPYEGLSVQDWNRAYQQVFYANVVLEGLDGFKASSADGASFNEVKGTALFLRAFAFYQISQQFASPYQLNTAKTDLGIPLRLSSDVNVVSKRGTLAETYERILLDLQTALNLLPEKVAYKTRPNKAACLAMLARVYLTMGDDANAGSYAQKALLLNKELIDYNTLSASDAYPLPAALPNGNVEVLFYSVLNNLTTLSAASTTTTIAPSLYNSYPADDLRKVILFTPRGTGQVFKGSYAKSSAIFAGLSVNELYLIAAESYARADQKDASLALLNALLVNRFKKNSFKPLVASTSEEALRLVLQERRKELVAREIRWTDLRRLNADVRFAVTIAKSYNGSSYELAPKSNKYVFPIPDDVVAITGMPQNPK